MSEFSFGPLASEDIVLDSVSQGPFLMGVVLVMHFWSSLGCHQPTLQRYVFVDFVGNEPCLVGVSMSLYA